MKVGEIRRKGEISKKGTEVAGIGHKGKTDLYRLCNKPAK
jgi:hypothetical protein